MAEPTSRRLRGGPVGLVLAVLVLLPALWVAGGGGPALSAEGVLVGALDVRRDSPDTAASGEPVPPAGERGHHVRVALVGWDDPGADARVVAEAIVPVDASDSFRIVWHAEVPGARRTGEVEAETSLAERGLALSLRTEGQLYARAPLGSVALLSVVDQPSTCLLVARLGDGDTSRGVWDASAWERAVREELHALAAAGLPPRPGSLAYAAWNPLPEAVADLSAFDRRRTGNGWGPLTDALALAGDPRPAILPPSLVDGAVALRGASGSREADAAFFARWAATATHPRVRERALAFARDAWSDATLPDTARRFGDALRRAGHLVPTWVEDAGHRAAPPWLRAVAVVVALLLAGWLLVRLRHALRRRPRVTGFVRRHAVPLVVGALGIAVAVTLLLTLPRLPAWVDEAEAARSMEEARFREAEGLPDVAFHWTAALDHLGWWRLQTERPGLPIDFPAAETREALQGLLRARAGHAKGLLAGPRTEAARTAALEGLLAVPLPAWSDVLYGAPSPTEIGRERRELWRVVALGDARRRNASGVRVALTQSEEHPGRGAPRFTPSTLDRVGALLDAPTPQVLRDGLFVLRVLAESAERGTPASRAFWTWFGTNDERAVATIVALVRQAGSEAARAGDYAFLERVVHEAAPFLGRRLAHRMAALADEAGLARSVRAIAVEMLCRAGDLPYSGVEAFGPSGEAVAPPRPDPALEAAALDLWRSLRGLAPSEAFHRRLRVAVDVLPVVAEGPCAWISRHAISLPPRREAWRAWVRSVEGLDPRTWLSETVDLPQAATMSADALADEFLFPDAGRVRLRTLPYHAWRLPRLHHVLALSAPDGVTVPVWCGGIERRGPWWEEPDALHVAWRRALSRNGMGALFGLSVVQLAYGGDVPLVAWTDAYALGLEQRALVSRGPLPVVPAVSAILQVTWEAQAGLALQPSLPPPLRATPAGVTVRRLLPDRSYAPVLAAWREGPIPGGGVWDAVLPLVEVAPAPAPRQGRGAEGAEARRLRTVLLAVLVGLALVLVVWGLRARARAAKARREERRARRRKA